MVLLTVSGATFCFMLFDLGKFGSNNNSGSNNFASNNFGSNKYVIILMPKNSLVIYFGSNKFVTSCRQLSNFITTKARSSS